MIPNLLIKELSLDSKKNNGLYLFQIFMNLYLGKSESKFIKGAETLLVILLINLKIESGG